MENIKKIASKRYCRTITW